MAFSTQLETWLNSQQPKTIATLSEVIKEKSFAIVFLILMTVPALPLPTGGITHFFEAITMLLSLEMIAGYQSIWLPEKWQHLQLSQNIQSKTLPFLIQKIRWCEKHSRPRLSVLMNHRYFMRLIGLVIFLLALVAFLAPPFSGLDTLPALGAVGIALAIILEDAVIGALSFIVGAAGTALVVGLSTFIWKYLTSAI